MSVTNGEACQVGLKGIRTVKSNLEEGEDDGSRSVCLPATRREPKGPRTNHLIYIRETIIPALMKKNESIPFRKPVDVSVYTEYYRYIQYPMDISTIRDRLSNRFYRNGDECLQDFQQMFVNCKVYNKPKSEVVIAAIELENVLIRKLINMDKEEHEVTDGITDRDYLKKPTTIRSSSFSSGEEMAKLHSSPQQGHSHSLRQSPSTMSPNMVGLGIGKNITNGSKSMKSMQSSVMNNGSSSDTTTNSSSEFDSDSDASIVQKQYIKAKKRRSEQMRLIHEQMTAMQAQLVVLKNEKDEERKQIERIRKRAMKRSAKKIKTKANKKQKMKEVSSDDY